jgi:zinc transporter 7
MRPDDEYAVHEHAHDHSHSHDDRHIQHASRELKLATADMALWMEALFATALVGVAPVIILFFVPLGKNSIEDTSSQKPLLRLFLSFAAGGLLGDALLHLLPHSMPEHQHDNHHHEGGDQGHHGHSIDDLSPYLYMLMGLMSFLMLEKAVRACRSGRGHSHDAAAAHKKNDDHDHVPSSTKNKQKHSHNNHTTTHKHHHQQQQQQQRHIIAAAGYLNLAADFSHNFTDGLAIGATFALGRGSGWQTTLAMLLHEVPHEIGDFAILIQSGFTRREAMWTQLYTALGAMIGTALGLVLETQRAAWITPFTAGGFIYIACTSIFPELLPSEEEDDGMHIRTYLVQSVLQLCAMGLGVGLMLLIALYE